MSRESTLESAGGVLFNQVYLGSFIKLLENERKRLGCFRHLFGFNQLLVALDDFFEFSTSGYVLFVASLVLAKRLFCGTCNGHVFSNLQFLIYNFQVEARKVSW